MTTAQIAIRVECLGKRDRLGLTHQDTLRETVRALGRRLFRRNGKLAPVTFLLPDTCHLA